MDEKETYQVALTLKELTIIVEALEEYLDALYRSDSLVDYKQLQGEKIWRLRERLQAELVKED